MELLDFARWEGICTPYDRNWALLTDFKWSEQGKDVRCCKGCFQRCSLSAAACYVQAGVGSWEEEETVRLAAVVPGRDRW